MTTPTIAIAAPTELEFRYNCRELYTSKSSGSLICSSPNNCACEEATKQAADTKKIGNDETMSPKKVWD